MKRLLTSFTLSLVCLAGCSTAPPSYIEEEQEQMEFDQDEGFYDYHLRNQEEVFEKPGGLYDEPGPY